MQGLDDTDREILRLLLKDGRLPYSDIADRVDLSAPAVSDRVDRLQELGVIERFTVDIDRGVLDDGLGVLVTIQAEPGSGTEVEAALADNQRVEHLFRTVDDTVTCTVRSIAGNLELGKLVDPDLVSDYDVRVLADTQWQPSTDGAEFAPTCDECGNTVTSEGEQERLDGTLYHFCCSSCQRAFLEQYERFTEQA